MLKDLGIDTIRTFGAGYAEFIMDLNPDWATDLNNFLTLCKNNGIKATFHQMGDWRPGTPISNQWAFGIKPADGIAGAKAKIDKLAGNNALGINFLTDPTVPFWIISNECWDFDQAVYRDWHLAIADYMRSKGAKVTLGSPSVYHGVMTPSIVLPMYRDHVDYIIFHWYDAGSYDYIYTELTRVINTYKAELGPVPVNNLLIGEIGCQRTWSGVTEDIRGQSYKAYFKATLDAGMGGLFPFILYDVYGTTETWGAIAVDGTYFTKVTDQYKAAYSGVIIPPPPPPPTLQNPLPLIILVGGFLYFITRRG